MTSPSIRAPNPDGPHTCPPFTFFLLHVCTAWPVGVIGLALSSSLVGAGVPVQRVAAILAAVSLAFTLEFVWAPMVDSSLTRRRWFAVGTGVMCACIVALLVAPWRAAAVPLLTLLAFCASSGAAVAAVSVKGIMAHEVPAALVSALGDLWRFIWSPNGALTAVLCVIPFGCGTEAGLIGAIAREWAVTPDQLATFGALTAVGTTAGAALGGWLSTRFGSWNAYLALGWSMIFLVLGFAWSPRTAVWFMTVELIYRAVATASYATLLGIVMKAIGKGAASTKAATLWSLANLAFAYPTFIEGRVHDRAGTVAMLMTDAGLAIAGFGVLLAMAWLLKPRVGTQPVVGETAGT